MEVIYISNDHLLELQELKDVANDVFVNDATVTVTLVDSAGNPVSGQSWPATMSYVAGSDGTYRVTLEDDLSLTRGHRYTAQITADAGSDLKGYWEEPLRAQTRNE